MKYKFNAFIAPILMLFIYIHIPIIVKEGAFVLWVEGIPTFYKILFGHEHLLFLVNGFLNALSASGNEILLQLPTFTIILFLPIGIILFTLINFFLGFKIIILNKKFKNTNNYIYDSEVSSLIRSLKILTRVFFIFVFATILISVLSIQSQPTEYEKSLEEIRNSDCPPSGLRFNPLIATYESC